MTYYRLYGMPFDNENSVKFYEQMLTTPCEISSYRTPLKSWEQIASNIWLKSSKLSSQSRTAKDQIQKAMGYETSDSDSEFYGYANGNATSMKQAENRILKEISKSNSNISKFKYLPALDDLLSKAGQFQTDDDASEPVLYSVFYGGNHPSAYLAYTGACAVIFSDFKVNPLIPEDSGTNYVTTIAKPKESDNIIYVNELINDSNSESNPTQSVTQTTSASITSEINGSESHTFGTSIKIGLEHEFAVVKAAFESEFSMSNEISTGWSESREHSEETSVTDEISVTVPPYSAGTISQTKVIQEAQTRYNCPVSVSYRVRIIDYGLATTTLGFSSGSCGIMESSGQIIADFTQNAQLNLKDRAVIHKEYTDKEDIDWTAFDENMEEAISFVTSYSPVSPTSAKFTEELTTVKGTINMMSLYPLTEIRLADHDDEAELTVGESIRVDNIDLEGLNSKSVGYCEFDKKYGKWIIVDEDGNELTDGKIAKLSTNKTTKKTVLKAVSTGTVYLKYVIDEDKYGTYSNPTNYATNDSLKETAIIEVTIKPITISSVKLNKTAFTYNGKVQKPVVKTINGLSVTNKTDYTASYSNASSKNAGTYYITVKGKGNFTGTKKLKYTISKAANPLTVKGKAASVKYSTLKNKSVALSKTKVLTFKKNGKGTMTYTKASGNKNITINKKTGTVTVKKGLKKGSYPVKVKIKAAGNTNYKASATKTVTFKIKVI